MSRPLPDVALAGPVPAQLPEAPFCGVAILGEAPGADEVRQARPFVGRAGQRLDRGLTAAGLDRAHCLIVNAFQHRPAGNRIAGFFGRPRIHDADQLDRALGRCHGGYPLVPLGDDVRAARALLAGWSPAVVVALGNTALWALTGRSGGITQLAGELLDSPHLDAPVLASWHPSWLLRQHDEEIDARFHAHLETAARLAARARPPVIRGEAEGARA